MNDIIPVVAKNAPGIPVLEFTYSWVDFTWIRSFPILKRIGGQTLQNAWPQLSLPQKSQFTPQIANYSSKPASSISFRFKSATYHSVLEPYLTMDVEHCHPPWKPIPLSPFSLEEFKSYLLQQPTRIYFKVGVPFYFTLTSDQVISWYQ